MDTNVIGRNTRLLRIKRGLEIKELAIQLDLSEKYLGDIERGKSVPSLETLIEIANYFGVSVNTLLSSRFPDDKATLFNAICANFAKLQSITDHEFLYFLLVDAKSLDCGVSDERI